MKENENPNLTIRVNDPGVKAELKEFIDSFPTGAEAGKALAELTRRRNFSAEHAFGAGMFEAIAELYRTMSNVAEGEILAAVNKTDKSTADRTVPRNIGNGKRDGCAYHCCDFG